MGSVALVDVLSEIFISPLTREHVGVTGENVARKYGVSRCEQDQLALESHRRAARAIENGYFKEQIVPLAAHDGSIFEQDEHVRHDGSLEQLAALKPIFQSDGGTVTAGNILGLADAAAVRELRRYAYRPLLRQACLLSSPYLPPDRLPHLHGWYCLLLLLLLASFCV